MSCCISIEAVIVPRNFPTHYLEGGRFFFDLEDGASFRLTKAVQELTDVSRIRDEAVLGFDLPLTDKNRTFLNLTGLLLPGALDNKFLPITVAASAGSKYLRQRNLHLVQILDGEGKVSCELRPNEEHWIRAADSLFLADIPFNSYVHDVATVEDIWQNNQLWDPTKIDAYLPLVHYGGFRDGTEDAYIEDFRPCHFLLAVLDKGFCEINWEFESPALETFWGKRLLCYLLKEDFYDYTDAGSNYRVDVRTTVDKDVSAFGALFFDVEDWDAGNNFDLVTSTYTNNQVDGFNVKVIFEGEIEATGAGEFDFAIFFDGGAFIELTVNLDPGLNTILIESECFFLAPGAWFQLGSGTFGGGTATMKAGFTAKARPCDTRIYRGDTINLQEVIDPDYTFLEFVKGVLALGFKVETDWGSRTVRFHPAGEEADIFGATAPGFYGSIDTAINIDDLVVCDSRKAKIPSDDQPRYLRYRFAKSDDRFIELNELEAQAPLWSRLIDLGDHLRDEKPKEIENPFFEPTANIDWGDVRIPVMWDNDDGAPSFDIGPRILYNAGWVIQTQQTGVGVVINYWNYEGSVGTQDLMPFAFQATDAKSGFPPIDILRNVAYQVPSTYPVQTDLFKMFLRLEAVYSVYSPEAEFLVDVSLDFYFGMNFRDLVIFVYQGRQMLCRVDRISDFDTCLDIPTPVVVRPEPMLSQLPECLLPE